jgi:hypothetical protein
MAVLRRLKVLAGRKRANQAAAIVPIDAAAGDEDDLPIPADVKAVFFGRPFVLAVLAGCYVAAEIVLPIVLAFGSASCCSQRWDSLSGCICRAD